jgi:hypothetical protein
MFQAKQSPKVVCLSSLFATDRILLHSTFLDHLAPFAQPVILSDAVNEPSFPRAHKNSRYFRSVNLPKGFSYPLTMLRHFETHLWDHQGMSASRESFWRLRKRKASPSSERRLRQLAGVVAPFGVESWLERKLEEMLVEYGSPANTVQWLQETKPDLLLAMYPFLESQMVTVAAAKRLGIPVMAFITSWDNITTKSRLVYQYDGYVVWSEQMKRELHQFYPQSKTKPVTVAGAPQYDVFKQSPCHIAREEFLSLYGLDAARPVILYCLGSPNMLREDYGARQFVERIAGHEAFSGVQVVIRAHPGHLEKGLTELEKVRARFPWVVIQSPHRHWQKFPFQGEEAIVEWINSVRHADVVINLSSTMTVDAAIFDRPVVNLDFDPEPGGPNQQMVKEANRTWNHFSPIAQSGGIWLVGDVDEMVAATAVYLKTPELHREQRRWVVEHVCGKVDGLAGKRMAQAVIHLLKTCYPSLAADAA